RSPTNHLEVGDPGQGGKNFILHTIGEKEVIRIPAQILKWQHRNAFLRWRRFWRSNELLPQQQNDGKPKQNTRGGCTRQNWIASRPTPNSRWRSHGPFHTRPAL